MPSFADKSYTYRRAMMDLYLPSDNVLLYKNPILSTAYSTDQIDYWYNWAVRKDKVGIAIHMKQYSYDYDMSDHYLVRRVKPYKRSGKS